MTAQGANGLGMFSSNSIYIGGSNQSNTRMLIEAAGNVGIGTTAPTSMLDVRNGSIFASGNIGVQVGSRLQMDGNNISIQGTGSQEMWFYTGGTNRIAITSAGNVGIGTTVAAAKLRVEGGISASGDVNVSGGFTGGNTIAIPSAAISVVRVRNAGTQVNFTSNAGTTYMSFLDSGNFGIGTTAPLTKLHLEGASIGKALAIFNETGNQDIFAASASGTNRFRILRNGSVVADSTATISNSGQAWAFGLGNTITGAANSVAIGDSNAAHTSGGGAMSVAIGRRNSAGTTEAYTFGLGLSQASAFGMQMGFDNNNGYTDLTDAQIANILIQASASNTPYISLRTANTTRLHVDHGGNIGIGTTSPLGKLHVEGATTGKALAILNETGNQDILTASASGTSVFRVTNDGELKLGSSSFTQSSGSNFAVGRNAGSSDATATLFSNENTSAAVFDIRTYNDNSIFSVQSDSKVNIAYAAIRGATVVPGIGLTARSAAAAYPAVNIYGHVSQTANMLEFKNSSDIVLSAVDAAGNFGIGTSTATERLTLSGKFLQTNSTSSGGNTADITTNSTGATGTTIGMRSYLYDDASVSGARYMIGGLYQANGRATASNTGYLRGIDVSTYNRGSGAITSMAGGFFESGLYNCTGTCGTVTNNYAGYFQTYGAATGTITNNYSGYFAQQRTNTTYTNSYGVYIDTVQGTNKWGIYQAAAADKNFFAGNVGIGTTTPGSKLSIASLGSSTGTTLVIDANGDVWKDSSSLRYKDNVKLFSDDFRKILQLNPSSFRYTANNITTIGYVAEELDTLGLTELVVYDKEGKPDAIRYDKFSIYLLEVLKQQQTQINELGQLESPSLPAPQPTPTASEWLGEKLQYLVEVTFTKPVAFLKDATFGRHISLNQDTSGTVAIPAGATRVRVTFAEQFASTPVVYLTPQQSIAGEYLQESVSETGFEIRFKQAQAVEILINWLAVMTETADGVRVEVLEKGAVSGASTEESSEQQSNPMPTPAVSATPEPTLQPNPTPESTPLPPSE